LICQSDSSYLQQIIIRENKFVEETFFGADMEFIGNPSHYHTKVDTCTSSTDIQFLGQIILEFPEKYEPEAIISNVRIGIGIGSFAFGLVSHLIFTFSFISLIYPFFRCREVFQIGFN
jgi:hypothetical protein